jgi:hypothetical protein
MYVQSNKMEMLCDDKTTQAGARTNLADKVRLIFQILVVALMMAVQSGCGVGGIVTSAFSVVF